MFFQIIQKEWLKLKFYFFTLIVVIVASLIYFGFNINFSFETIEPESMMWYKFAHLEDKPYFYLSYFFIIIGVVIAFAQFLPEKIQNRIKIMVHLPLDMKESLSYHLIIGSFIVGILCTIFSLSLLLILLQYYPEIIIPIAFKDTIAYSFAAIVVYIGFTSAIIEKNLLLSFFKLFFTLLFISSFLKNEYYIYDILWLVIFIIMFFLTLDSFYSIKQQRVSSIIYKSTLFIVFIGMLFINYQQYKKNYSHEFNKYYIFYSNILKDFVYQKNFGEHQFEYAIKDEKSFDRITYESYLPFVYWKNLDVQNKLPILINNTQFHKKTIKNSRLGFSYTTKLLEPLEAKLYPLFNPQSNKGMISFPEEMFIIDAKKAYVYEYDKGISNELTIQLNHQLQNHNFTFPALNIWGKATNMKPYDKGYLILDSKQNLFNLKRYDDKIEVTQVKYPQNISLAFIKLSENKQRILSGYAIDIQSNFYLLDWDFKFIKLDLQKFDYKEMKLKLISNPINYLIRYDDGENYYAIVLDKQFHLLKQISLKN